MLPCWWTHNVIHLSKPTELYITKIKLDCIIFLKAQAKMSAGPRMTVDCEKMNLCTNVNHNLTEDGEGKGS